MAAEILTVLLYILRHHGNRFRVDDSRRVCKESPRLLAVFNWIEQHLADPQMSVADLARTISLSEVYFRKLFRRVTGIGPAVFVQRHRIERACMLLRGSQMSIKQIAEMCGFLDVPFFYRIFKHWAKVTPARYRDSKEI